ncbi:MAG: hypothetical protein U9P71_08825 [Campylobacterota bacterium]|nr:hypothetical protein [Campylobacterota bacterium]
MKFLLILTLCISSLFSANILSYNIYDRSDRVDVMFTFDTPFKGSITQKSHHNKIIIKLENTNIESPKIKNISSEYVSKLTIAPIENEVQIIAKIASNIGMKASKTSDGYGLRLRFMTKVASSTKNGDTPSNLSNFPTKPDTQISTSYMIVIALLLLGIVLLLIFKQRLTKVGSKKEKHPSTFTKSDKMHNDVNIRFQKSIDTNNKVVMLEYGQESYLVVVGNSNLLLDRFDADQVRTQNEFDEMLDSKHQELDEFLKIKKESGAFESYKDKASGFDIDEIEIQEGSKL